jgi:hypothetical protein
LQFIKKRGSDEKSPLPKSSPDAWLKAIRRTQCIIFENIFWICDQRANKKPRPEDVDF